jgi:hypothetical protein
VATLARQLEPLDDDRGVRAVILPASPDELGSARHLMAGLRTELADRGTQVVVAEPDRVVPASAPQTGVRLTVGSALASAREWRRLARESDGTVLVVTAGRTDVADLREARAVLAAAGAGLFSIALVPPAKVGRTVADDVRPVRPARPGIRAEDRVTAS